MRIFIAREPLDFRTRTDGTAAACRGVLRREPMSGALFVFRNRASTMIRILVYDGDGYWLMTKRLSQGRFRYWCVDGDDASAALATHQLQTLIAGGDWNRLATAQPWRSVQK